LLTCLFRLCSTKTENSFTRFLIADVDHVAEGHVDPVSTEELMETVNI